jgi:nitrite reductase (NO-forming)
MSAGRTAGPHFAPGPSRADDRRIAVASIVIAALYLAAAAGASVALATGAIGVLGSTPWLPLHLALTGGASTAIAGVMPFFVSALAAGKPAPARVRAAAVGLVALGAGLVALRGLAPVLTLAPVIGGVVYLAGIAMTALALQLGGRTGLMMRRPVVTLGYTLALVNVGIGGTIGTLVVAGWAPAVERLVALRAAHAWTNLLGFVSLVIMSTLLHFLPTVLGTRIVPRVSAAAAVLATAGASLLVVAGFSTGWVGVAGGGAVLALIGAGALVVEAKDVHAARGVWSSDADWHFAASASLLAGIGWFATGATLAAALVLARALGLVGDDRAWFSPLVAGPLAIGWVVQVLIGSWTHLLPAIGPGSPADHARQRSLLGTWARPRVAVHNVGTACVALGWPFGIPALTAVGALLVAASVVSAAGLAGSALRLARRG